MAKNAYVGIAIDDYIQSSGTQYIDTGVTPNQDFGFELDFIPLETPVSSSAPAYINAGGAGGNTGVNLRVAINAFTATTTPNGEIQLGDSKVDNKLTVGVRQTISLKNKVVTFPDGTTTTLTTNNFTSPNTLVIFGAHMTTGATVQRMSKMKLFRLKLYNGNTLVRDFVPAYNNSQYCLYDNVSESYFYNGGTGSFTGSVGVSVARKTKKIYVGVEKKYTPIEYIQNSGEQYIETGFKPNQDTSIEMEVMLPSSQAGKNTTFFGARNAWTGWDGAYGLVSFDDSNKIFQIRYNGRTGLSNQQLGNNTKYKIKLDKNSLYVDDVSIGSAPTSTFSTLCTLPLFANSFPSNIGETDSTNVFKLYYCKMWDNGTLIRDFIPVLDSDNVPCLYERVSGEFYHNQGMGDFIAGSTIGTPVSLGFVARRVLKGFVGDSSNKARLFFYYSKITHSTPTQLSLGRNYLASASTDDYALFAGGYQENGSAVVDSYSTTLAKGTPTNLSSARYGLAGSAVYNSTLFGGGYNGAVVSTVDTYTSTLTHGTTTTLSTARSDLSAITNENYVLFGGGSTGSSESSNLDIYNSTFTRINATSLSTTRKMLATAKVGRYSLFAGGRAGSSNKTTVDAFNPNVTRSTATALSQARYRLTGTSTQRSALFAGGEGSSVSDTYGIVDAYNVSLVRSTATALYEVSRILAGTSVGNMAFIGGGVGTTSTAYRSTVNTYNKNLVRETTTALSEARSALSATSVGNYALFAGGGPATSQSAVVDAYYVEE